MKSFKISIVLVTLLAVCFTATVNAQDKSAFPYFGSEKMEETADIFAKGDMDYSTSFLLPKSAAKQVSSPSKALMKKLRLPKGVKVIKTPIVLEYKDSCYKIGCQKNRECKECLLLWKDLNKDGRIQPRSELRCVCPSGRTLCRIAGKKVECKKKR